VNTTSQLNQIRPYLGYSAINYVSTRYFADYNGLQASLLRRFRGASMVGVSYTWSKALANNEGLTESPYVDPQNRFDLSSEWGPTVLDRRNMLIAHFIYEFPFYRSQQGFRGKTLGGWEISGIVQAVSGLWLTVTQTTNDPAGQGILDPSSNAQARLDMTGNPNGGPHALQQFFNTGVFAQVPGGLTRPGNEKRASVLGPGYQIWNTDVFKNFEMRGDMRFQIRVEAFNTFNHVNYSTISTGYSSTDYGTVTAARDNRVMQLGAKFYF